MLIKSKYKIARRLGYPVFEKTQTQKFTLSLAKRGVQGRKGPRAMSDYGKQLLEKQKVRYTYLINERQLKRYVRGVLERKGVRHDELLYKNLEMRLDTVVYRLGFAATRLQARQLVSHGHFCVNGMSVNIPSYATGEGDVIRIREGSSAKKIFTVLDERLKEVNVPAWLSLDPLKQEGAVKGPPKLEKGASSLDLNMVLEFYKR